MSRRAPIRRSGRRSSISWAPGEYIYPVGRLDFDSEGLLLLTNDGDLAARLTHPSHGVPGVRGARAGSADDHDLRRLARGIVIDGRRTQPAEAIVQLGATVRA